MNRVSSSNSVQLRQKLVDSLNLLVLHMVGGKATVISGIGGSVGRKYFFINNFNNSLESGKANERSYLLYQKEHRPGLY